MKWPLSALLLITLTSQPAAAKDHHCASEAKRYAAALLALHFHSDDIKNGETNPTSEMQNSGIEDSVSAISPIKAAVGKGMFDVLEVTGHIYKADYRMHFIFAQAADSCILMGQEILEMSNPY